MGRTPCCAKEHNKKGAWSIDEDQRLINHINLHGEGNWRTLPQQAGLLRCGKSCRLRWINYLKPGLKRGNFTKEEDDLIIHLHRVLGNKWSLIAARLPGRTDNEIKNYWNTHIKRMLYDSGIDPSTHEPLKTATTVTQAPPTTNKKKKVIMNNNSTTASTASTTSTVISSSNNNINTEKNTDYHYFNVYLSTKVNFESMNGEESNSCSGVSTEEAQHPHLNLDLSLAPPISSSHYPQVSHSIGSDLFKPNEQQQLQSAAAATNNNVFIDFMGPRI